MVRRAIRKKEILHSLSHHSISIGFLAISIYCFSLTWNMWRIVGVFCFHENHGEKRCRENVMYSLTTEVMNSNFLLLLLSLLLSYMFKWGYQTNDLQTVGIAISTMASLPPSLSLSLYPTFILSLMIKALKVPVVQDSCLNNNRHYDIRNECIALFLLLLLLLLSLQ